MASKKYYVMELHGPGYKNIIYSKSYAIECLEHNREKTNGEWKLFQVWKSKDGNELKREEILPYTIQETTP